MCNIVSMSRLKTWLRSSGASAAAAASCLDVTRAQLLRQQKQLQVAAPQLHVSNRPFNHCQIVTLFACAGQWRTAQVRAPPHAFGGNLVTRVSGARDAAAAGCDSMLAEMVRMDATSDPRLRLSSANRDFVLSKSYQPLLVFPKGATDEQVQRRLLRSHPRHLPPHPSPPSYLRRCRTS